jgi:hypothetical protein
MLGLGHISDPSQVMNPYLTSHSSYENGDREGLWWLGSAQGCVGAAAIASFGTQVADEPVPFGTFD